MKRNNQTNALLVELLIVILFFMLGSVILIRVFGKAYQMTSSAEASAEAMVEAQSTADILYAAFGSVEELERMGFAPESGEDGIWRRTGDQYDLRVTIRDEERPVGVMRQMKVEALKNEEVLITLPCSRYGTGPTAAAVDSRGEETAAEQETESITEGERQP